METSRAQMLARDLRGRGISDPRVLAAFEAVPREVFVLPRDAARAYADQPLEIGCGQTISQPYVVALTAEALHVREADRLLEIGAGSGYAAAIFGRLAREVDTVELIDELAGAAAAALAWIGSTNVHVHRGDGSLGWPAGAPYDAIAVAAGAPVVPPSLLAQLAPGGRLVIPVGSATMQRLMRYTRTAEGVTEVDLGDVRFVPLLGAQGWPDDLIGH